MHRNNRVPSNMILDASQMCDRNYAQYFIITTPAISNGNPIPLERVNISTDGITVNDDSNAFTISDAGLYLFSWWFDLVVDDPDTLNIVRFVKVEEERQNVSTSAQAGTSVPLVGNLVLMVEANSTFMFQNQSNRRLIFNSNGTSINGIMNAIQIG